MRIGICTNLNVCQGIGKLDGAAGVAYVEPAVADLLCPAQDEAAFQARLAAVRSAGLPVEGVNCLFPGTLKTCGPEVDDAAADKWIQTVCRRAAAAGVKRIVYGSGGSRKVPDGFGMDKAREQIVGHLKRFGPIAARHGVVIVLEPLNKAECNIVTSVAEGAGIVRDVNHPSIRLLADTYHMARDGEGPRSIRDAKGLIFHVHAAEGNGRGPLGTTGEDQRPYFRALKDIGYDERISIECSWEDFNAQLGPAIAELRKQWDES
jgi:sugar phosphate isomerase/epimerase